jgi:hypothetical protein
MNFKLEGNSIVINVYDLLGSIASADRKRIVDAMACQDEVINEVMNQVIDGWTSEGSHAGRTYGGNADAVYGIDGARMRIAKASSEIANREIERLAEKLKRTEERINAGWDAYHEAMHSRMTYA